MVCFYNWIVFIERYTRPNISEIQNFKIKNLEPQKNYGLPDFQARKTWKFWSGTWCLGFNEVVHCFDIFFETDTGHNEGTRNTCSSGQNNFNCMLWTFKGQKYSDHALMFDACILPTILEPKKSVDLPILCSLETFIDGWEGIKFRRVAFVN